MNRLALLLLPFGLASCGLIRAPVKIVGGVVQGTAQLTKAAATAPGKAWDKRQQRKQEEEPAEDGAPRTGGDPAPGGDPPPGVLPPDPGPELPAEVPPEPLFDDSQPAFDTQDYEPVFPE